MIRKSFLTVVSITTIVLVAVVGIMLSVASGSTQALPIKDPQGPVCPWMDTSKSPDERAQLLLAASTFDQKIRWLDEQAANNPTQIVFSGVAYSGTQVPCTPIIQYTDGPASVSGAPGIVTAFPSQTALAATWDTALSRAKGKAQGYEAFHEHRNVILGPGLASGRIPMLGRTSEYLGEDSLLAGVMAGSMIRGMQDNPNEPVEAVIKHYVANEQELDRNNSSSNIDERALHEIYALPFEVAIKEGNPGGVMCSYNQVNSTWACENSATIGGILKTDIGFKGWVVSDFGAVHSTVPSLVAGMDQELNRPVYYKPISLTYAYTSGLISMAQIDAAAFRVVRSHFAAGLFDVPLPPAAEANVSTPQNQAVGLQVALEGSVLLKNKDGILPLSNASHHLRIAVIGPTASISPTNGVSAVTACGATAPGVPCTPIAPLDAITARAAQSGDTVVFNDGSNLDAAATAATGANVAIVFGYYREGEGSDLPNLSLVPQISTGLYDPVVAGDTNIKVTSISPITVGSSIAIDTGVNQEIVKATAIGRAAISTTLPFAATAGDTNIKLQSMGGLAAGDALYIDSGANLETVTVTTVGTGGATTIRSATNISATSIPVVSITGFSIGDTISIDSGANLETRTVTNVSSGFGGASIVVTPALTMAHAVGVPVAGSGVTFTPALSAAHAAGVSVRSPGTGITFTPALAKAHASGAAVFSSYGDDLISAVAAANPNTVVVLQTGGPVLMPWIDNVKGVLETWYAGQSMGTAIAQLLYGDVNPSGKLPSTFPKSMADLPTAGSTSQYPGIFTGTTTARQVSYLEGLQVGYRWYDAQNIEPLFPFGFGLSYTSFDYSDLKIQSKDNGFEVSFTVRNAGSVTGTEVPQLYVGLPSGLGEPPKRLAGWSRITLQPGESQDVTLTVDPESSDHPLSYWDPATHQWMTPFGGTFNVMVGASSRDIRLSGTTQVFNHYVFLPLVLR